MKNLIGLLIAAFIFAGLACNDNDLIEPEPQQSASEQEINTIRDTLYLIDFRVDSTGKTELQLLIEGFTIVKMGSTKETAIAYAFPDTLCGTYVLITEDGQVDGTFSTDKGCD